jgi:tRNA-specific 2-thiouridylase
MSSDRIQHVRGRKVLVAMSGGVDSSVAAALLREQGADVVGVFMRLGSEDSEHVDLFDAAACRLGVNEQSGEVDTKPHHQGCCSLNDATDGRLVAAMLDIPFYVVNFRKDFGRIIDYFVDEYNAGRTPNPCVRCNDWLKFGKLADYASTIGADFVATGHYARIAGPSPGKDGPARLLRGIDHSKDQSYVLFGTPREQLRHMLLPIGELTKARVREIAQEWNLPVFDKPDSQEICFVPDNDYAALVRKQSPDQVRPGAILDTCGNVVGEHGGHQHFTVGQRRGVGVALGHKLYVVDKDAAANTITIGERDTLLAHGLAASQTNWLIDPPTEPRRCSVKIRYNSQPVPAHVVATGDDALEIEFDSPQTAVSPGQAAVCYDGDELIGGGWIDRPIR